MVEVSTSDYIKTHRGQIALLKAIHKAGQKGIGTRKLCERVMHTRGSYCSKLLQELEDQEFIERTAENTNPRIIRITPKGRILLASLKAH